jgi:arginase family enzyme
VSTTAVFFPFDLFGSSGTSAGAELLADAVDEMIADNRRECLTTRADAYNDHVRTRLLSFSTLSSYQDWRKRGGRAVQQAFRRNDFLLWVTGNHLGVLPVYEELAREPDNTLIIQFDAHLDIQPFKDCTTELSHGNYLLHCTGRLPAITNIGHRDLLLPADYIAKYYRQTFAAADLIINPDRAVRRIRHTARRAARVFIDIDCDVFDPAFFPALTHPLPFGLSPHLVLRLVDAAWSKRVIGFAFSEFDPGRDRGDQSLATLLWFLEYLILRRHEPQT